MTKVEFKSDWVEPDGVNGPELSATWAALEIRVGDAPVTRVLDAKARTVRDFVYVPLYPLAEWLVANWWFLTQECENPAKAGAGDFRRRHSLVANREGYAYPDLNITPSGTHTRLSWTAGPAHWSRVEFLKNGEAWLDNDNFRETCADFIDGVIRRLVSCAVVDTYMQEEWAVIQAADSDEARFCAVAAGLGWDPYALDDAGCRAILRLDRKLGVLLDEAVHAMDARNLESECAAIISAAAAGQNALPLRRVRQFADGAAHCRKAREQPWASGYELARSLRDYLGIGNVALPTTALLADALQEHTTQLEQAMQPVDSLTAAPLIDGVIARRAGDSPAFAFRRCGESRRFHFCRALAEVIALPGKDALITKARSARQQRNRAFAAEFLAPSDALRERVKRPFVDADDIAELADEFGVYSEVVRHQVVNHNIARSWQ